MNNEYIRREDAKDALQEKVFHNLTDEFYGAMQVLDELEPADVVPVVHGEWLNAIFDSKRYRCSICNYHISNLVRENYCPNCGAKMDGGKED